jgi:DNA polymerase III subunit delta
VKSDTTFIGCKTAKRTKKNMTADDLIQKISKGKVERFYFLHGSERYYQVEAIRALTQKWITDENREFNLEMFDCLRSSAGQWLSSLGTLSFLGGTKLVIVRNLHEAFEMNRVLPEEDEKSLIDYVKAPYEDTCLIITADKVDSRRKLFKALIKAGSVSCEPPKKESELMPLAISLAKEQGYSMSNNVAKELLRRVGARPGVLFQEIEKTIVYAGNKKAISMEDVSEAVGETAPAENFGLANALRDKNLDKAMGLLRKHLDQGDAPEKILGGIAGQFRTIWLIKSCLDKRIPEGLIAKEVSLNPYVVKLSLKFARQFSTQQLRNCYSELAKTDRKLKTTPNREEAMETLIVNLHQAI